MIRCDVSWQRSKKKVDKIQNIINLSTLGSVKNRLWRFRTAHGAAGCHGDLAPRPQLQRPESENPSWNNNFTPRWRMVMVFWSKTEDYFEFQRQKLQWLVDLWLNWKAYGADATRPKRSILYQSFFPILKVLEISKVLEFWGKCPSDVRLLLRWRHPEQDVWRCLEHRMLLWRHVQRSVPCR